MTLQFPSDSIRNSRIPRSERVMRLLREATHLRNLISSYHHEPHTERQFTTRAVLKERLKTFEANCRKAGEAPVLQSLMAEFSGLQRDALSYLRDTGT